MVAFREDKRRPGRESWRGMCDHLFETTSRYDRRRKVLTFLLRCATCETETLVESLRYEPAFRRLDRGRLR
jgi:hypothetical protein